MYFILAGILDGKAGFAWCTLQAFYEYLILLKVAEMKQGLPTPTEARNTFHPQQNGNNSNSQRSDFVSLKGKVD
ncbi:hypothetical protein MiHa_04573 [Microcystis aeruginosa NIES-2522]|nr:hypothetical protein MiHa_04573 [Microcystis aeruginosa NIES-2522]